MTRLIYRPCSLLLRIKRKKEEEKERRKRRANNCRAGTRKEKSLVRRNGERRTRAEPIIDYIFNVNLWPRCSSWKEMTDEYIYILFILDRTSRKSRIVRIIRANDYSLSVTVSASLAIVVFARACLRACEKMRGPRRVSIARGCKTGPLLHFRPTYFSCFCITVKGLGNSVR